MAGQRTTLLAAALLLSVTACGQGTGPAEESRDSGTREDVPSALEDMEHPDFPDPLIDTDEILSGGPPPDGIPPIDEPRFQPAGEVDWLDDDEPVLSLTVEQETRAYPLQVMTWHEIVNDTVAGVPVAVTYCPLCNSGVAFERRVAGRLLDFGTSGRLYADNLVMYDRQTESLWPQLTGQASVGVLTGTQLKAIPKGTAVGGTDLVVWHRAGQLSALDGRSIAESRDVGTIGVFEPRADGRSLRFEPVEEGFRDDATGSTWDVLGRAVSGPLEGEQLPPHTHLDTFWFAWVAFQPDTRLQP